MSIRRWSARHPVEPVDVETVTHGRFSPGLIGYARRKVVAVAGHSPKPIRHARITLSRASDPAASRPAHVSATLDLDGHVVRAHAAAATLREAVDALHDRLDHRLSRATEHREARRGGMYRHGASGRRTDAESREIVRHRTYEPDPVRPDDAVLDMERLGDDFHLFTDATTGQDAVVYRGGPTGYRLARVRPSSRPETSSAVPLTVSAHPAPRLTVPQAVERIDLTAQPFLFFADPRTERGHVLYRRRDGRYALLTR